MRCEIHIHIRVRACSDATKKRQKNQAVKKKTEKYIFTPTLLLVPIQIMTFIGFLGRLTAKS